MKTTPKTINALNHGIMITAPHLRIGKKRQKLNSRPEISATLPHYAPNSLES
jgi:hypothetical protein